MLDNNERHHDVRQRIAILCSRETPHHATNSETSLRNTILSQLTSHTPLVKHVPRQRQEVTIRRILPITLSPHSHGSHGVQVKVLELVSELHLSIPRVRDLHEELLRPRLVLRRVLLLLTRQRSLLIL